MASRSMTPEQALAILAATPTRIVALMEGLTPAQLRASPAPAAWSANDVLAHLRSCADIWGSYIARILSEDTPTIRVVNPTTYIKQTNYPELDFRPSLQSFVAQRGELLSLLKPLPPASWSCAALVTGAGTPRQRTVLDYAERFARHERAHIRQIERIVATLRG